MPAYQPKRRLVADDATEAGGANDGSACLRADGQWHHEIRNGCGRPARRSSRRSLGILGVGGLAWIARREFCCDRLAHDDAASLANAGNASCIPGRAMVRVDRRPITGRHVDRCDDVLYADRNAAQGATN